MIKTLLAFAVVASLVAGVPFILGSAYREAQQTQQAPELVIFSQPGCVRCEVWKKEFGRHATYENYRFTSYTEVRWMGDINSGYWVSGTSRERGNQVAVDFVTATGGRISGFPTFWIRGSQGYKVGYGK